MKAAIIQSNYLPWRGYFDIIREVDTFVFLDDVLYSKGSWRNRNRVKTPSGPTWLTVPVPKHGISKMPIDRVPCNDPTWQKNHYEILSRNYREAPYFADYRELLEQFYCKTDWKYLSDFNQFSIREIAGMLGCETNFVDARSLHASGVKDERVLAILQSLGATRFLSGPSAKNYMNEQLYTEAGISVEWKTYEYPEYPQLYPPYDPAVSILDLLFMTGPSAADYIWGTRSN